MSPNLTKNKITKMNFSIEIQCKIIKWTIDQFASLRYKYLFLILT